MLGKGRDCSAHRSLTKSTMSSTACSGTSPCIWQPKAVAT
ncbi:Uncharacterised protein [Bordetella pertussis]|nr:Uncharacterised protein [Bordetella pertussis]